MNREVDFGTTLCFVLNLCVAACNLGAVYVFWVPREERAELTRRDQDTSSNGSTAYPFTESSLPTSVTMGTTKQARSVEHSHLEQPRGSDSDPDPNPVALDAALDVLVESRPATTASMTATATAVMPSRDDDEPESVLTRT